MCKNLQGIYKEIIKCAPRGVQLEVFSDAIKARACAVILAHNHPSGNLEPSAQDIDVTREMLSAGKLLGIRVLDHLIFNGDGFSSLLESGVLEGEWGRMG